jgi:serine/threonine protein kinase
MASLIGQSLGRYHILEQLGEGGMATVYKARDTTLERDVAFKIIRADIFGPAILEILLERFKREARALAKLSHPNVVPILDFGEYAGAPYLIMPYISGGTLKQALGKPIRYQDAIRFLVPIAYALHYAHQEGIVHRDVKPSNILMTRSGNPMLSDFGIAKLLDVDETRELTGTGVGIGTPEYMAPEQGMGRADERSDIYALGIVFYEMITGRIPFRADTPMAILLKKNQEPLPRPKKLIPSLPDAVENALIKALVRDPLQRYADMYSFAKALENLVGVQDSTAGSFTGLAKNILQTPSRTQTVTGQKGFDTWMRGTVLAVFLLGICVVVALAGFMARDLLLPAQPTALLFMPTTPDFTDDLITPTLTDIPVDPPTLTLVSSSPTDTPIPATSTVAATITVTSIPPTSPKSGPPFDKKDPDAFFGWYFTYITTERNYKNTWNCLTDRFKKNSNPDGYDAYVQTWSYVTDAKVSSVNFAGMSKDRRHYKVNLTLIYKNGTSDTWTLDYYILYDKSRGHWMFDSK